MVGEIKNKTKLNVKKEIDGRNTCKYSEHMQ